MIDSSTFLILVLHVVVGVASPVASPVVDLGYALHQASVLQASTSTNHYYNFSNIRYAAPPLGQLRFKAPQAPLNNRSAGVQDGLYGNICPQAFPAWLGTALETHNVHYYDGVGSGQTESEDCLFLDVVVPEKVFRDKKQKHPVMIWIYGGGYVNGDKISLTNPIGLLERAQEDLIFVAFNYRLGAFGFLAGPKFTSEGGNPNVALLDQKMAFEWVQSHIHLFGGDPERVTIMGESAGAGAILNHVAAANTSSLFDQIIVQSPIILPHSKTDEMDNTFQQFLDAANVSNLEEARKLPSEVLIGANQDTIAPAIFGSYVFGPAVDDSYVRDLPGRLLLHKNVKIKALIGHNSNEGGLFVDPTIQTDEAFNSYIPQILSNLPAASQQFVINNLYPPIYDGSRRYKDVSGRLRLLIDEAFLGCTAHSIANARLREAFEYVFAVPPGLHGQDIAYTFFTDKSPYVEDEALAVKLQDYITRFARTGNPNCDSLPKMPSYETGNVLELKPSTFTVAPDVLANKRCRWWQANL